MIIRIFKECCAVIVIGWKAMLREPAIHIYLFKTASALIAFLATAYLAQLFALLPLESQATTNYEMAQVEVNYYVHSENNSPKDIALAQGKLNAAKKSKTLILSAVSLLELVAKLVFILLWPIFILGVGHWWLQVIRLDYEKKAEDGLDGGG